MNIRRLLKYTLLAAVLASGSGIRAEIPDADPDQLELMGRDAIRRNAWDEADSFLTQALRLAEIADEPRKIAQNAYHLAMCRAARGEWDAALKLLDTARDEWARSKGPIDTARILEARILRRTGNTDRARAIARGLLDGDSRDVSPRIEIQALLILSKLDCERGDVNNASERLKQAGKKMKDDFPLVLKARLDEARGALAVLGKEPGRAARMFDSAANLFRKGGRYLPMARMLFKAGEAFEEAGEPGQAALRYFRAARSLFAFEKPGEADLPIREAMRLREHLDEERRGQVEALYETRPPDS